MPGRKFEQTNSKYRFGFNGKEKAAEISNNAYDFDARILDSRIGRWLSGDPAALAYPSISPFVYAINSPLIFIDPTGKWVAKVVYDEKSKKYNLTFVAEKGDNLETLSIQLGIPKTSLLKSDPSLKSLKVTTDKELKLEKVKEVININYAINKMLENLPSENNCATFANEACGDIEAVASLEDHDMQVWQLAGKILARKYTAVKGDASSKIGDIIHYKAFKEEGGEEIDEHFAVVILKDKTGKNIVSVMQKNGARKFETKMFDPNELKVPETEESYIREKIGTSSIFRPKNSATHGGAVMNKARAEQVAKQMESIRRNAEKYEKMMEEKRKKKEQENNENE